MLEAARTYTPPKGKPAYPHIHALIATMLLTGGRKAEVLGLMAEDVRFDRGTVTFRPNSFRRLKRTAPCLCTRSWREILQAYLFGGNAPKSGGLLFPSTARQKRKVKRIYGHLGNVRHRSDAVEYRIEQHDRRALAAGLLKRSNGKLGNGDIAKLAGVDEAFVQGVRSGL